MAIVINPASSRRKLLRSSRGTFAHRGENFVQQAESVCSSRSDRNPPSSFQGQTPGFARRWKPTFFSEVLTLRGKFSALPWEQGSSGRQAAPQVMLTSRTRSCRGDQHPFHGKSLEHSAAARPFPLPPSRLSWKGKAAVSVDVTYVVLRDAQPRCSGGSSSPEPRWWRAGGSCPLPSLLSFPRDCQCCPGRGGEREGGRA